MRIERTDSIDAPRRTTHQRGLVFIPCIPSKPAAAFQSKLGTKQPGPPLEQVTMIQGTHSGNICRLKMHLVSEPALGATHTTAAVTATATALNKHPAPVSRRPVLEVKLHLQRQPVDLLLRTAFRQAFQLLGKKKKSGREKTHKTQKTATHLATEVEIKGAEHETLRDWPSDRNVSDTFRRNPLRPCHGNYSS